MTRCFLVLFLGIGSALAGRALPEAGSPARSAFATSGSSRTASTPDPDGPIEEEPHLLEQVAVVGASLSKGFLVPLTLADVLDEAIARPHARPVDLSQVMMFSAPSGLLDRQLGEIRRASPSLVVGVDLAFWFGYGDVTIGSGPLRDGGRVENLQRFLSQLEGLEVPIVLADFPDMREAVGLMLRDAQVPSARTIAALNEALYAWASARKGVIVLPLNELTEAIRADEGIEIGGSVWPAAGNAGGMLQADRLHPTLAGMVLIARLLAHHLVEAGWSDRHDFVEDPEELLASLLERAGSIPAASDPSPGPGSSDSGSSDSGSAD